MPKKFKKLKKRSKKKEKKASKKRRKTPKKEKKIHVDEQPDVFLMIRRKKTTIFLDAKEDTSVLELKRMVAGITKVSPENQKLFSNREEMQEVKSLSDYGYNGGAAKPQSPGTISLVFRDDSGNWEEIDIAPLSQPPELPEVMKLGVDSPDSRNQEQPGTANRSMNSGNTSL